MTDDDLIRLNQIIEHARKEITELERKRYLAQRELDMYETARNNFYCRKVKEMRNQKGDQS